MVASHTLCYHLLHSRLALACHNKRFFITSTREKVEAGQPWVWLHWVTLTNAFFFLRYKSLHTQKTSPPENKKCSLTCSFLTSQKWPCSKVAQFLGTKTPIKPFVNVWLLTNSIAVFGHMLWKMSGTGKTSVPIFRVLAYHLGNSKLTTHSKPNSRKREKPRLPEKLPLSDFKIIAEGKFCM